MKVWTLTVDTDKIVTTVHATEAEAWADLRENYAKDFEGNDGAMAEELTERQGVVFYLDEHEISEEPSLEFEFAVEVTGEPSSRPDAPPNFVLRFLCPHCLALDTVTHRDVAIRWNGLADPEVLELDDFTREVLGDDYEPNLTVTASVIEAQKNFEDDGYFCMSCRIELTQPHHFDVIWS